MIFDLKNEYMEEIWKDVKGYEELYQVSNYGQIRSVDRTVGYRYKGKQRIYKGRMLKQVVRNGYLSGMHIENNLFEEYLNILNTMSYREIQYLLDYKLYCEDRSKIKKGKSL